MADENTLLTTTQAARLCSVTPDTVLKWIRSGRLPARRTAGGHHRIHVDDLDRVLRPANPGDGESGVAGESADAQVRREVYSRFASPRRQFRYCWEYNGRGKLFEGCQNCVVYQMRAQRCYEVIKLAPEIGHNKLFCKESCAKCNYFKLVHEQPIHVLVVTGDKDLSAGLKKDAAGAMFRVEVTECEYTCSAVVDHFRPDFAVVDCSMGPEASRDITRHLLEDPRIPFARVILAATEREFPSACDREVFARIERPFGLAEIAECIGGVGSGGVG
jgi:excisionase family DNA binding protein